MDGAFNQKIFLQALGDVAGIRTTPNDWNVIIFRDALHLQTEGLPQITVRISNAILTVSLGEDSWNIDLLQGPSGTWRDRDGNRVTPNPKIPEAYWEHLYRMGFLDQIEGESPGELPLMSNDTDWSGSLF
jgi:hypothetical protein